MRTWCAAVLQYFLYVYVDLTGRQHLEAQVTKLRRIRDSVVTAETRRADWRSQFQFIQIIYECKQAICQSIEKEKRRKRTKEIKMPGKIVKKLWGVGLA